MGNFLSSLHKFESKHLSMIFDNSLNFNRQQMEFLPLSFSEEIQQLHISDNKLMGACKNRIFAEIDSVLIDL